MNGRTELSASDVSVIVPVGDRAPAFRRCAESLSRLEPPPGEIVAVIDGPNDELASRASEIGARVVVLEERGGPARARNFGGRTATKEILLFLDSDIEAPPELAARVAELLSSNHRTMAVFGSYDDAPSEPGFLSQYRNLLHHFVHQGGRERASTFWAGCGAIRRETFNEVGGFDERYEEPSIEDIELGSRLVRAGHPIRLVKDMQVKHMKRWRLTDILTTDLLRRAVPWTELMLREGQMVDDLNVKFRDRISVVMAFALLAALAATWLWPAVSWAFVGSAALAASVIVLLNIDLFQFFRRERGILFAAGVFPLYWLYLLTCGLGFGIGLLRHLFGRKRRLEPV